MPFSGVSGDLFLVPNGGIVVRLDVECLFVSAVLLPCGWMDVEVGSFDLGTIKPLWSGLDASDDVDRARVAFSVGARWDGPDGESYTCPLTSILAIRGGGSVNPPSPVRRTRASSSPATAPSPIG